MFKPERFLEGTYSKLAYIPFGIGPRNCIGQRFAKIEIQMCSAKIFKTFRFDLPDNFALQYQKGNEMLLPKSLSVKLSRRSQP